MLLVAFVLSAIDYATPTEDETSVFGIGGKFVVGVGALLLGGVLMVVYSRIAPPFFRGETLGRRSAEGAAVQESDDSAAPSPSPGTPSAFTPAEPTMATQPIALPKPLRTSREPEPAAVAPKPSGRHREELFKPRT
jgi:hypothetical protein